MTFTERITEDIKQAMKAREAVKLEALRGIKKELIEARTAKAGGEEVSDADAMKILQKMVKQRRETSAIYKEQGRPELAAAEDEQADVIAAYLPKELTAEEIEAAVKAIIAEVGATSIKEMGKVMGVASKKLAGQADGKAISDTVKKLLNN
ncbi:MAG: GatB/YqeY domain-containing protein [Bacteroidales bacterium]|nr:GatB/YqeY domain-containing protein [Bacteroidales bacterium]